LQSKGFGGRGTGAVTKDMDYSRVKIAAAARKYKITKDIGIFYE